MGEGIESFVIETVLISLLGLLSEEVLPGVRGGDEGEVGELEGAGVEEGEVFAAGGVGEAIADADRRVQGGDLSLIHI